MKYRTKQHQTHDIAFQLQRRSSQDNDHIGQYFDGQEEMKNRALELIDTKQ